MMNKVYLYPLPIRIWHWINAAIIIILIITGLQLRFSAFAIMEYSTAALYHKYIGFTLVGSFLFWFIYCIASGAMKKHYSLRLRDIKRMFLQGLYYAVGMFKGKDNPFTPTLEEKFNPLQKLSYLTVMLLATPIAICSGILLSDIFFFLDFIRAIGGLRVVDAIHVAVGYFFVIYLLIHIYMSTLGETFCSYIKTMITGYGRVKIHDTGEKDIETLK